ncbi:hypothetical protein GCM10028777_24150 [Angustibacter speluncae]
MFRRLRVVRGSGDEGVALPMVLGTMFVLTTFLLTSLAVVLNNMAPARSDQDSRAAVAAAQAGIDEYISRLSSTSGNYWEKGNTDPTNPAFDENGATPGCGTGGRRLPGTGGAGALFCYRVTTSLSTTAQQGYIDLEATGVSTPANGQRPVTRELTAKLRPEGFIDYIYFTDIEVTDPELNRNRAYVNGNYDSGGYIFYPDPDQVKAICDQHYYANAGKPGRAAQTSGGYVSYTSSSSRPYYRVSASNPDPDNWERRTNSATIQFQCGEIQWTGGDVVNGPLHSNDALQINGPVNFTNARTETSWNKGGTDLWWGTSAPVGNKPVYDATDSLPDANTDLLQYVQPKKDSSSNTNRPGCMYSGQTRIKFEGTKMKVLSPFTNRAGTPSTCLNTANRANEQTLDIPPVIYVESTTGSCSTANKPVGYPRSNEDTSSTRRTTDYNPCRGTVLVEGNVDGQVTIAADEDIVVTADLTVEDELESDVIGLLADNYVWVYHPVKSDGSNLLAYSDAVRNVEAAILSLRHSFVVQNWNTGGKLSTGTSEASKLRVWGAIAQKYRGPVGTGSGSGDPSTGYLKNYIYDSRLQVLQPPYFLTPKNAPWRAVQVTDG